MNQPSANILSIRVFGSQVRADADRMSDTDVLVIVDDHSGLAPEKEVLALLPKKYRSNANLSWYGRERIASMFREGHLFAWHLYHESVSIFERDLFFSSLGTPTPYPKAIEDIKSFIAVLGGIAPAIKSAPANVIYELGLLYVCARNIAMAASWHLNATPDFSRYSPFNLPLPIECLAFSKEEYECCMLARMASQRGSNPKSMSVEEAINLCSRVLRWGQQILNTIQAQRLCA